LNIVAASLQFDFHRGGIDAFEKPKSEFAVNVVERTNDRVSELLLDEWPSALIWHFPISAGAAR
jgi:hypothetical protein